MWSGILVALTPVLIWISGFHGDTDPVFVFLVLLSVYLLGCRRRVVLAGVALGLALNVKLVPVIALPAFFVALPSGRARVRFFGALGAMVLLGYGYHLCFWFDSLWRNVICYKSWPGLWGFSQVAGQTWSGGWSLASKVLIVILLCSKSLWALFRVPAEPRGAPQALSAAVAWAFLIFLIFMPGFGVQYLAWFAAPSILLSLPGAMVYNALASIFLFGVYSFWANGTVLWSFA